MIRRFFTDLPTRQVHARRNDVAAGDVPLLLLHASPGSSKQVEPLLRALAARGHAAVAPDTPGYGDSDPIPAEVPTVEDFAAAQLEFADALGYRQFDLYGSHTGAAIAVGMALAAPDRVRRLVLDGKALFDDATAAKYVANYAPEIAPDVEANQVLWARQYLLDQIAWFPWFEQDEAHARNAPPPDPKALHGWIVELLKAIGTYHHGYRATFRWNVRDKLRTLKVPLLALAQKSDPLDVYLPELAQLVPGATIRSGLADMNAIADEMVKFLA